MQRRHLGIVVLALGMMGAGQAQAQLSVLSSFTGSTASVDLVGAGFDTTTDTVWIHREFTTELRSYSRTGGFLFATGRPGESADDADIEFAPVALTLGSTLVPRGTLLFINGETGFADIYAVDKTVAAGTPNVIATLNTSFGVSHVVGGAYHPGRDSFFLVQDRVPDGSANDSLVAEIDAQTGEVLNRFKIDDIVSSFTVNFGDLDISTVTGNLFIVSSDESSIAEFTPDGAFVRLIALPSGVGSLSGLGIDDLRGEAWATDTNGTVWQLGNLAPIPEPETYALLVAGLGLLGFMARRKQRLPAA